MLPNKQYFKADGNQIAVYFTEIMAITQGAGGSYSHRGTKNMDEAAKDAGISPAFAPFDGTITWKQTTGDITGILFSSDKPVWTAALGLVFINLLMWHDNSTADLFKGKKIKQGQHLYDEGTAGRATGNHIHYGVSTGKFAGGYPLIKNEFGNWELPGEVNAWDVFFVNDTTIRNGGGYNWKTFMESAAPVPPTSTSTVLKIGDKVKITGINWATGQPISDIVKKKIHTIGQFNKDKSKTLLVAAVDINGNITSQGVYSWIFTKDIQKI